MKSMALLLLRAALAIVGAVAVYVLLLGSTSWLADQVGYESGIGRGLGLLSGALSLVVWGVYAIAILAVALFLILSRFAFRSQGSSVDQPRNP